MARRSIDSVIAERRAEDPVGFQRISFLNGLRRALKRLRGDMAQTEIANRTGRGQSEISRLESAVTGHTRIGTLIDYAQACGGSLVIGLRDKNGATVSMLDSKMTVAQVDAEPGAVPTARLLDIKTAAVEALTTRRLTDREAFMLLLLKKARFKSTAVDTTQVAKALDAVKDPKTKISGDDLAVLQVPFSKLVKHFAGEGRVVSSTLKAR